ncbi:unnamed protein product [Pseudo-nitzschia multistriata]|uniref:Uncharacterized protein n=1 Tax=Pseudo-nitzschia multistriata TaxID=183589 RepID=A0A448YVM6_9STRA|nr:unnamed protein product [Pseudo-nitzschia multistriata]
MKGLAVLIPLLPILASGFGSQSTRIGTGGVGRLSIHRSVALFSSVDEDEENWLDYLKWGGQEPGFDVLERAKEFTSEPAFLAFRLRDIPEDYYSEDYVFRGPVVGPINRRDLVETNAAFLLNEAFPDLQRNPFGHCIDPENPFRVLYFDRWKGTNTGELKMFFLPPTNKKSISPVTPFSVTFAPDGKVIYETVTTAVDRFEGNTKGKVAVFGLLETAGIPLDNSIGNPLLIFSQKLNRFLGLMTAQTQSKAENVPSWWKSRAVGAEPNDR